MHWFCREDCVVVKFTKVTREQRSGVNTAVLSRVTFFHEDVVVGPAQTPQGVLGLFTRSTFNGCFGVFFRTVKQCLLSRMLYGV